MGQKETGNQSGSAIFDSVFKTLLQRFPRLAASLINEVFHTRYAGDEDIVQGRNEYHDGRGRVINDSVVRIGDRIYHFEVQSTKDGLMTVRMIEYDFKIALEEARNTVVDGLRKNPGQKAGRKKLAPVRLRFPRSCVIYLREGLESQDSLDVDLVIPDGQTVSCRIPAVQAQDFTKEEIFEKKLLILLPFYVLRYEKDIRSGKKDVLDRLEKDYEDIRGRLVNAGKEVGEPRLYYDLAVLIQKVLNYVGKDNDKFRERMCDAMGGVILEMESDRIWDEATDKAYLKSIRNLMETMELTVQQAMDALKIPASSQQAYREKLENL